jgi:hypothetical protein
VIAETDIERALEYLRSSANEAAAARANMKYLAEFLDVKMAQIIKTKEDLSVNAAKGIAKADPDYLAVLDGYRAAVELDARHQFKREAADALIRAWQTQQSTLRAEGKAYG